MLQNTDGGLHKKFLKISRKVISYAKIISLVLHQLPAVYHLFCIVIVMHVI